MGEGGGGGGFIDLANPLPYIPNYFSLEPALSLSLSLRLALFFPLQLFVRGCAASRVRFSFSFFRLPSPPVDVHGVREKRNPPARARDGDPSLAVLVLRIYSNG